MKRITVLLMVFTIGSTLCLAEDQPLPFEKLVIKYYGNQAWSRAQQATKFYQTDGSYQTGHGRGCNLMSWEGMQRYTIDYYLSYLKTFKGKQPPELFLDGQ